MEICVVHIPPPVEAPFFLSCTPPTHFIIFLKSSTLCRYTTLSLFTFSDFDINRCHLQDAL